MSSQRVRTSEIRAIESFGGIDADVDELLRTCFQDHPAYIAARDMKKFLVLGRKGAGKTAIYRQLITRHDSATFNYGHTFDDYPWNHHDLQAQVGVPEERRYIHSWKYLMLLGLAKLLLNSDQSQPWSAESEESLIALEEFVVDSYGSRDPDLSQLFTPGKELKFKGGINWKVFNLEAEKVRVDDLPVHIQAVNSAMQRHIFTALNPSCSYYVCFDQLDLGFTLVDKAYAQRLVGLILAARDLFLAAREQDRRFSPVVFLRDDIYQDLQFEDKNKITENYSTRIAWTDADSGFTLKSLMERRFTQLLGEGSNFVEWKSVFDESREMPSRQTKYRHITDRTFLRPRDMIKFCNEVLNSYKNSVSTEQVLDNSAIHSAREAYSDYLLNELDDEIAKHVPNYKTLLEILKSIGSEKFDFEVFKEKFDLRGELRETTPSDALADLFAFSVVSYLKPGGRGGGSEYVWRYKDPRARFDSTAASFRVHPGFKEALDLTR